MSTANKAEKQGGHGAAWANLIVCGGISWAVSLWHATHPEQGTHPNTVLALLIATAPILVSAFGSHNIAKRGGGWVRKTMTILVFGMGMALSVKAQAQSVGPIVGNVGLGVVFALMLDVSTFLALSSIMSKPTAEDVSETPVVPPVSAPAWAPVAPPVGAPETAPAGRLPERLPDRLPSASQVPVAPPVQAPATPAIERPKQTRNASGSSGSKKAAKGKLTPAEARAEARRLLKANPDMTAPALAEALGKAPKSGHVRDMKNQILREMQENGEIPSVRSIGA